VASGSGEVVNKFFLAPTIFEKEFHSHSPHAFVAGERPNSSVGIGRASIFEFMRSADISSQGAEVSLKERISEDLKRAMKSGDKVRLSALRMIRARILEMDKRGLNREMTEEEEVSLVLSEAKKRRESIDEFTKGGRNDLVEKESKELEIVNEYLPKPLSREEARNVVEHIIKDLGGISGREFGKIMALAMKELRGKIDGKIVQEIVKSKLET
jgi:uncharacterized protein YqeY